MTKEVWIYVDDNHKFKITAPSVRDFFTNDALNISYHIWTKNIEDTKKISTVSVNSSFALLKTIIFDLGLYDRYQPLSKSFQDTLKLIIPDIKIDFKEHELKIDNTTMTEEIWDYFLYVLKLCCGEKVTLPPNFTDEASRQFYLAQKKNEERIAKLRAQKGADEEGLIKVLLSITYSFPSLTMDYLRDQTMAQIQWLQKQAAGAVSYEVNAQAFAAGNVKKGATLDFFIK